MPREAIEAERSVERISVLDEDGDLDGDLEPEISDERLVALHRGMLLARRFDERLLKLQRQGRIGTFAPVKGQEAAQIGSAALLKDEDWMIPAFRETAAMLWRGARMSDIILFNAGYNEGAALPEDAYTLPIAIPVASQIPHAVGLSYAMKVRGMDRIAMTYFGDGATSEGDFHEALNFAAVFTTPTVFVCQNNQWAISVPRERQTKSKTLAQKALAYDIPALQVDGNDVLAVFAASKEAVKRARDGNGPTMIECVTYRMSVHTTADDPSKYRDEDEVEKWEARDPINRFAGYLKERKLLDDDAISQIEDEIETEIEEAWREAKGKMDELGDPVEMFDHVYADLPAPMKDSRDTLEAALELGSDDDNSGDNDSDDDKPNDSDADPGKGDSDEDEKG